MKQLIICLFLVISTGLLAQSDKPVEKGQLMLGGGGSFGYGTELSDSETTSGNMSISLYPSMGLFVSHGFALGVSPSIDFSTSFGDYTNTNTSLGLDIFLVKYFDFGLFIRGSFGYDFGMINLDPYYNAEKMIYHSVAFIPAVGYAFFLGPNVALEIAVNNKLNMEFRPEQTSTLRSRSYFSAGFQIFL